jgi:hypothetical protein
MSREVIERDLRAPEFREGDPDDYERRDDGKIVRKDRWEVGLRNVATIVVGARAVYEIPDIVDAVRNLQGVRMHELLDQAEEVFESSKEGLQVVEYIRAVINSKQKGDAA